MEMNLNTKGKHEEVKTGGKANLNRTEKTSILVKTAILGAISFILMAMDFPIPLFPAFLKLDFSEIPALVGAFAMGPAAGVAIELIKNVLHLVTKTQTGGVGELGNFIVGASLVWTAGMVYRKHKTKKHAIIGCILGTAVMTSAAFFFNLFVLIPFYANVMPIDAIIAMGSVITDKIHDIPSLVLYGVTPFNIFKGLLISLITMLIYKRIKPLLKL